MCLILNGQDLLCIPCKDHLCTFLVFQTEKQLYTAWGTNSPPASEALRSGVPICHVGTALALSGGQEVLLRLTVVLQTPRHEGLVEPRMAQFLRSSTGPLQSSGHQHYLLLGIYIHQTEHCSWLYSSLTFHQLYILLSSPGIQELAWSGQPALLCWP